MRSLLRCFITLISVKVLINFKILSVIQKRGSGYVKKALLLSVATLLGTWCSQGVLKVNEGQKCFVHLKLNDLSIQNHQPERENKTYYRTTTSRLCFLQSRSFYSSFFFFEQLNTFVPEKNTPVLQICRKRNEKTPPHTFASESIFWQRRLLICFARGALDIASHRG